jgi:hypothetical protein
MAKFRNLISYVLIFISLPFFIALFLDKQAVFNSSIEIKQNKQKILNYYKDVRNLSKLTHFKLIDPNLRDSCAGEAGEIGSSFHVFSEHPQVRKNIFRLESFDSAKVVYSFRFYDDIKHPDLSILRVQQIDSLNTMVSFKLIINFSYPSNILLKLPTVKEEFSYITESLLKSLNENVK